jgi:hypothetical protein
MSTGMVAGCTVERQGSGAVIVCLPAFGDSARRGTPCRVLSDGYEVAVLEVPGLNRPGRLPAAPAVTDIAIVTDERGRRGGGRAGPAAALPRP